MVVLILAILATWRISSMLAEEEGPGFPGLYVRYRTFVSRGRPHWVRKGVSCVWCTSFWIGLFITCFLVGVGEAPWFLFPIWWMGLSGGAITLHSTLQAALK